MQIKLFNREILTDSFCFQRFDKRSALFAFGPSFLNRTKINVSDGG